MTAAAVREIRLRSLADTEALAAEVAGRLRGGEVIGLIGDLGAGKTAFTGLLAKAMGVSGAVRSPTFVLMQILPTGPGFSGRTGIREICHVDAYRLEGDGDLRNIGFGDYAGHPEAVAVVEWADRLESLRRNDSYREIAFSFGSGEDRLLTVDARLLAPES